MTVKPGVTKIAASAIENAVGTLACPFVTGIIATTAIDDLFNQWNGEFDEWFDNLKAQLSDNVVANLQRQIDECKPGITAKGTIIDPTTAQVLQIAEGSNVDDALLKLAMPEGKYALQITLLSPGNRPIPNVAITGITTITGGAVSTDANGKVFGFATSNPVTVTADLSKFLDLTGNVSRSFSLTSGTVNQGVMTATRASSAQKLLTASGSFHFSPDVAEYDWSAIGGGYNGGTRSMSQDSYGGSVILTAGSGGNAGGIINRAGNVPNPSTVIQVIVGAIGGKSSVNGIQTPNGATGGIGARTHYQLGGRNAGNGASTTDSFLYPPTTVGGAGGGGGEIWNISGISSSDHPNGGSGGSPGGGAGGYYYTYQATDSDGGIVTKVGSDKVNGEAGQYYGSGGGGAATSTDAYWSGNPGAGKQGVVGFMWRYKS